MVVADLKDVAVTMSPQHHVVTSMAFLMAHLQALWGGWSWGLGGGQESGWLPSLPTFAPLVG